MPLSLDSSSRNCDSLRWLCPLRQIRSSQLFFSTAFFAFFLLEPGARLRAAESPHRSLQPAAVADKVVAKAEPFDLREVQLLDGPFKHARDVNHQLLLKLDLDRMLYPFRREAGLPSPVKGSDELFFMFTGHVAGHYLSACALDYRNSGDAELKKRADHVVAVLAECQAKIGNGYIGGFSERAILAFVGLVQDPSLNPNVPWYCLHKVYAGLLDMYLLTGNEQALEVLKKAADWIDQTTSQLPELKMQSMLGREHGGMNEVLANLYAATGEEKYLRLSQRFNHHAILDPFAKGEDPLDRNHANTQIPKFIGVARQYELTGDPDLKTIASGFWKNVTEERSYVTGGDSEYERFTPKGYLSHFLGERLTETCNVYNMLKLTRHLFCLDPQAGYSDFYERALINQILSTRHPETGGQLYFQFLQSGESKTQRPGSLWNWAFPLNLKPEDAQTNGRELTCCPCTGMESNAKYEDSIYFHNGKNELYVNLFIPSVLDWKEAGLTLRQETGYPQQGSTRLILACQKPLPLTLKIRRPWWATKEFQILVNGEKQETASSPGSYVSIERTWQNGDKLEVLMPMSFHMEGFKDNPKRAALMYGPLVMAGITEKNDPFSAIVTKDEHFLDTLKPVVGKPLEFTAPSEIFRTSPLGAAKQPVVFRPFYQFLDDAYAIYWDVVNPEDFQKAASVFETEIERQKELAPRTVDLVRAAINLEVVTFQRMFAKNEGWLPATAPSASEKAHDVKFSEPKKLPGKEREEAAYVKRFQSETVFNIPGEFHSINPGEWRSYQMKVLPNKEQELEVSLWKTANKELGKWLTKQGVLEILLNGNVIGTCDMEALPAGQFSKRVCPLSSDQLKDKKTVEVMLRVSGDSSPIYGIYECRILKK